MVNYLKSVDIQKEIEDRKITVVDLEEKIDTVTSNVCFETGVIDGVVAANTFRNIFGLATLNNGNLNDSSSDDL